MKRILWPLVLMCSVTQTFAYTPFVYINGQPHNATSPWGMNVFNNFLYKNKTDADPSLIFNSTSLYAEPNSPDLNYGAYVGTFTYYQKLDVLAKGLSFQLHAPLVLVTNIVNTKIVGPNTLESLDVNFNNTGFADLVLLFGYNFINKPGYRVGMNVDVILPTGRFNNIENQFEPTFGNGGHAAPGISLETSVKIVGTEKHNLLFNLETQYHYSIFSYEEKMLGLKRATASSFKSAFLGQNQLVPGMDETLSNVSISSAGEFDSSAGFIYNNGWFYFDFGLEHHYKAKKTLTIDSISKLNLNNSFNRLQLNGRQITLTEISPSGTSASIRNSHLLKMYSDFGVMCKEWKDWFLRIKYAAYFNVGTSFTVYKFNHPSIWDFYIKAGIAF